MDYRILDLGNQYKVASLFGMRYALHFNQYSVPVAALEDKLVQLLGIPLVTPTLRRATKFQSSYRWYVGWKNLRANPVERLIAFRTECDRTLALLIADQ